MAVGGGGAPAGKPEAPGSDFRSGRGLAAGLVPSWGAWKRQRTVCSPSLCPSLPPSLESLKEKAGRGGGGSKDFPF